METRTRRCWGAAAAALCVATVAGCFAADFLAYTPCATSESCADAGLLACVLLPDAVVRGFCSVACDADAACPAGQDGEAAPRCAAIDEQTVCVLACDVAGATCPEGYVCTEVTATAVDGEAPRAVCFPEAAP
jgi:hypothetical protein